MRQELVDMADVGSRLMSNFDINAGMLKTAVTSALRSTELAERAHSVNLIQYPMNNWTQVNPLAGIQVRKVVNVIPHIIDLKKTVIQEMDQEILGILAGQFGASKHA